MNLIELQRSLRQLRLGGMANVLETRLRQAQAEPMAPIDLLSMLVSDELARRSDRLLERRRSQAGFRDANRTLDNFDFGFNPTINRQLIFDLATCHFVERHENVLIQGPAGVGKSHLAQALGHEACRRGYDVIFANASRLLAHLHGGRADGTYERRLLAYTRPDLLIIDDFGLKALPAPGPEDLYEIVNERYERGLMIVTSNRAFSEWPELFGNPLLASAALDRLADRAHQVVVTGDSYRSKGRRPTPGRAA